MHNHWISISDLLSGFVLIFLLMFVNAALIPKHIEHQQKLAAEKALKSRETIKLQELQRQSDKIKNIKMDVAAFEQAGLIKVDVERKIIELQHASFQSGSACLTYDAKIAAQEIGRSIFEEELAKEKNVLIYIEGHTDPRPLNRMKRKCGVFKDNVQLSTQRAANVREEILSKAGSGMEARFPVAGFASSRLKNKKDVYSPENRRVSLRFVWESYDSSTDQSDIPK